MEPKTTEQLANEEADRVYEEGKKAAARAADHAYAAAIARRSPMGAVAALPSKTEPLPPEAFNDREHPRFAEAVRIEIEKLQAKSRPPVAPVLPRKP